jgi:RNA polymerase sigma-70 factor (ECF subfamily)
MFATETSGKSGPEPAGWFATTHWSVVLRARDGESDQAREALGRLCRTYWPPLYAFIRREGHGVEDAQDLTQEFFARLVEKDWLNHLQHQRGRFRSFLLTFLKHFLSDERDRARAQKRGGGKPMISLDQFEGEEREGLGPVDTLTADQVFERRYARAVLRQALNRLREEYTATGQTELFDRLKDLEPGERGATNYAELGARWGMTEAAIKSAVHRLRRRHRELLREEIAQTVGDPAELQDEIRHLLNVLGG